MPKCQVYLGQGHCLSLRLSLSCRWTISTREPERLARVCYTWIRSQMLQIPAESGPKIMHCLGHALPLSWILLLPLCTSHEGWECRIKTEQRDKWHCRSGRYRTCTPASFLESNCCSFTSQITPLGSKSLIPSVFSESWASRSPKEGKHKLALLMSAQFGSAQTSPKPTYRARGICPLLLCFQSTCKITSLEWAHKANEKRNLESSIAIGHPCFKEQSLLFKCRMENGGLHKKCKSWIACFAHYRFNNHYLF